MNENPERPAYCEVYWETQGVKKSADFHGTPDAVITWLAAGILAERGVNREVLVELLLDGGISLQTLGSWHQVAILETLAGRVDVKLGPREPACPRPCLWARSVVVQCDSCVSGGESVFPLRVGLADRIATKIRGADPTRIDEYLRVAFGINRGAARYMLRMLPRDGDSMWWGPALVTLDCRSGDLSSS